MLAVLQPQQLVSLLLHQSLQLVRPLFLLLALGLQLADGLVLAGQRCPHLRLDLPQGFVLG